MVKYIPLIAFLITALLFSFSQAYAYTEITGCTQITSPGEYRLTQDISFSTSSPCILIQADDVVLDCQWHTIKAILPPGVYADGIYVEGRNNVKIMNCVLNGSFMDTVYLYSSTGCILENIVSTGGDILLDSSTQNILINISATGFSDGLVLADSNNNTVMNSQFYSNSYAGIIFDGSNNNSVLNSRIYNNEHYGAKIVGSNYNVFNNSVFYNDFYTIYTDSDGNVFSNLTIENGYEGVDIEGYGNVLKDSIIRNNSCGLYLYLDYAGNNLIYNNIFNNTNNFCYDLYGIAHSNYFNTTLTLGTNIVGGPYIGGNYWGSPDGTGYSDTCSDSNKDGICDSPYTLTSNGPNIDYLPLAKYVPPRTEITGCTQITSPGEYRLTQDIIDTGVSVCIDVQSDNVVFDCQGHILDQVYPPPDWSGIGINIDGRSNVTIKNCVFGDWFYYGIYSGQSSNITILNCSFTFGSEFGQGESIRFSNTYNCHVDNVTSYRLLDIRDSTQNCYLTNSYFNGGYSGIYISGSSSIVMNNIKSIGTNSIYVENSDYISVTNSYLFTNNQDGIDLIGVKYSNFNNIEIKDSYAGWDGIWLGSSSFNNFTNIVISSFRHEGIMLSDSSLNNSFFNISISDLVGGDEFGIYITQSNGNYFKKISIKNAHEGIVIDRYSANNVFEDFTISDMTGHGIWITEVTDKNEFRNGLIENIHPTPGIEYMTGYGIRLEDTANQVFHDIIIKNSDNCGISLWSSGYIPTQNNLFYNNIFMNRNNTCFEGNIYPNYWNTTLKVGKNILGGPFIGGNFWGRPDGKSILDELKYAIIDGIYDHPYDLLGDGTNVDYHPLAIVMFVVPPIFKSLVGLGMGIAFVMGAITLLFGIDFFKTKNPFVAIVLAVIGLAVMLLMFTYLWETL